MKYRNKSGWIEIYELNISKDGGVQVEYFNNTYQRYFPACIFPSLDEEVLFRQSNYQDWARATSFEGTAMKYMMTGDCVYWNYFITYQAGEIPKQAKLRVTVFESSGRNPQSTELDVDIDPGDTLFINNFTQWQGAENIKNIDRGQNGVFYKDSINEAVDNESGWRIDYHRGNIPYLTNYGKNEDAPLRYCPQLNGEYELLIGFKEDLLEIWLELPGKKHLERIRNHERIMPVYQWWKEISVGRYNFTSEDSIGIHKPSACCVNKLHPFGDLVYLKLVPVSTSIKFRQIIPPTEVVFYAEPYSLGYYGELQSEDMVESLFQEYLSLGIDTLSCQVARGGGVFLYRSEVTQYARSGASVGDDHQFSDGANKMMAVMDVLDVFSRYSRKHKLKFIANMGMNACSRGSNVESKFSADNPQLHHPVLGDFFDFTHEEVIEYVAAIATEIAQYDIDGICFEHMRYQYGQTFETIMAIHRRIKDKIGSCRYNELEISVRFPVDNHEYYKALEQLFNEGLVDVIIPSRQASIIPDIDITHYVQLAAKYGKAVQGCLDGWAGHYTKPFMIPRPAQYEQLAKRYSSDGAKGLFFYQSEQILENVFLRRTIKKLTGKND